MFDKNKRIFITLKYGNIILALNETLTITQKFLE
jgi:hypothetical protein